MKKYSKKRSIFLRPVSFPLLFSLALAVLLVFGAVARTVSRASAQMVLSEDDERDDEKDSDDGEDDENNEDENDSEDRDDEDGDENDVDLDDRPVLIKTVTNPDGTVTKTYQITDDGEVVTKTVTYDANGRVVSDDKEHEDGTKHEETTELISTKDNGDGTVTKTFKITDDDGDIEMKAITYDKDGKVIKIVELNPDGTVKEEEDVEEDDRDEDGHEIEFEYKNTSTSSPKLNNLIEAELEQEIETNSELGTTIDKVELEVKTVYGEYEYEGTTFKDGKFLGLFDVSIPVDLEIDPATGQIVSINQSFWSKLLDFFSTN